MSLDDPITLMQPSLKRSSSPASSIQEPVNLCSQFRTSQSIFLISEMHFLVRKSCNDILKLDLQVSLLVTYLHMRIRDLASQTSEPALISLATWPLYMSHSPV